MNNLIKINDKDNVAVCLDGELFGHKIALADMKAGEQIIKYGYPIGTLTDDVKKGDHIHDHNLKTNLSSKSEYTFFGDNEYCPEKSPLTFNGYLRADGRVGIRNEIWIIPTVGCVNDTAVALANACNELYKDGCDGVFAYTHPYGCSQMGDDQEYTQKVLSALVNHPNAGGVLVLSLGCENNNLSVFKKYLGNVDESRVKFMVTQDVENELEEGKKLITQIYDNIKNDKRTPVNIDKLVVGYKCGGSDAFSGITANMLCGKVNDMLTSFGATTILTEVPEMFGAEHILLARAKNEAVFNKAVDMINSYKDYFDAHNQVCYENPSPGNHDGGITTLEEKSLGCVQKGGTSVVCDVLHYAQTATKNGLNLLYGPGNDIVSTTNLVAAGAQIVLFTTGRGTPLGTAVPTVKIATNSKLASAKPNWIDFDAGKALQQDTKQLSQELLQLIIDTANGALTKNEQNNYRQIAIFKNGVTM